MASPRTTVKRSYTTQNREALALLGSRIALARKTRKMSATEAAERAGISRLTLRRIERGDPKCEIGLVFEVAVIVGEPLFSPDPAVVRKERRHAEEILTLLPKSIHQPRRQVIDDF